MTEAASAQPYRVLARKYRPRSFSSLIGQEAMVRTLSNAIAADRLAHAFILAGVRGVGKTTTARIIAAALNCVGADGEGGPTADPCGRCAHCESIAADSNVDVMEMDAASHTSVDNIRELNDGIVYRPVAARYKIYIIDEVHMLSRSAFNALLKTLEEPPEYAKFIFATTEIRSVPVTVLSRCQRFDLRRVPFDVLAAHLSAVAEQEGAAVSGGAIGLIARAAGGSVRDGLSLLDQAIAHGGPDGGIGEDTARAMLGVAERVRVFELFEQLMTGEIAAALERFDSMHESGADPIAVLRDVADLTHLLTRLKAAPGAGDAAAAFDLDLEACRGLAARLPMAALARAWQMLLKGLAEADSAPSPAQAAEMVLVRIAYAAGLPSPSDLIARLSGSGGDAPSPRPAAPEPPGPGAGPAAGADGDAPASFEEVAALFAAKRKPVEHAHLVSHVHLVRFEAGKISIRVADGAPRDLANTISKHLGEWTGRVWLVEDSREEGAPTLWEQREAARRARRAEALAHPLVRAALDAFPGAELLEEGDAAGGAPVPAGEDAPAADRSRRGIA